MRRIVSVNVPGRRLSPASAVRAVQTTRAPSIARRTAIASPIPRLAPVTSAILPFSTPFGLITGFDITSILFLCFHRNP
jgi:hypothetical protein